MTGTWGTRLGTRNGRGTNRMRRYRRDLQALSQWAGEDSNLRLTDYESAALTAELPARRPRTLLTAALDPRRDGLRLRRAGRREVRAAEVARHRVGGDDLAALGARARSLVFVPALEEG